MKPRTSGGCRDGFFLKIFYKPSRLRKARKSKALDGDPRAQTTPVEDEHEDEDEDEDEDENTMDEEEDAAG